jgi:pilus assembly protein CpaE
MSDPRVGCVKEGPVKQATVVLGIEDLALQEEVLHFLDRLPSLTVAGATADGESFVARVREVRPDAAVVSTSVLGAVESLDGHSAVLVVAEKETTGALRAALGSGARGFYVWPDEREALARDAKRATRALEPAPGTPGRVVAVYGPRGGAGVTFLAANLAAACAARGASTVLVDLDPFFADVTCAIGVPPTSEVTTVADLVPVLDELTQDHLERVLYAHPAGFRALLGPPEPSLAAALPAEYAARAVELLRTEADVVILHLPRALDEACRGALELADEVLLVVSLDVLSFRAAHRALTYLGGLGLTPRCRLVVNRAAPGDVVPDDVERVFGLRPLAILKHDRAIPRAMNRGELVARRSGQVGRCLVGLARHVVEAGRGAAGDDPPPANVSAVQTR